MWCQPQITPSNTPLERNSQNTSMPALGFCDHASWANCEVREKTNKMQQLDVYF